MPDLPYITFWTNWQPSLHCFIFYCMLPTPYMYAFLTQASNLKALILAKNSWSKHELNQGRNSENVLGWNSGWSRKILLIIIFNLEYFEKLSVIFSVGFRPEQAIAAIICSRKFFADRFNTKNLCECRGYITLFVLNCSVLRFCLLAEYDSTAIDCCGPAPLFSYASIFRFQPWQTHLITHKRAGDIAWLKLKSNKTNHQLRADY